MFEESTYPGEVELHVAMVHDFDRYPLPYAKDHKAERRALWRRDEWLREIAHRFCRRKINKSAPDE